jgi:glycosyltransferase involved in cell wall biosynthesis
MRILVLNHEFPPVGGGGGHVAYNIGRQFVSMGHSVTVLTTGCRGMPEEEFCSGIRVLRIPGVRNNALDNNAYATTMLYLWTGTRIGKRLVLEAKPDVIHADFTIPAGILGVRLGHRFSIPVTITLHGSDVPGHNPGEFRLSMKILKPLIRSVWKRANRVIAVSESLKMLACKTMPELRVQVVHNGIDLERFTPYPKSKLHKGPLRLLCVSRLVKIKGIQFLLQALRRIDREGKFSYQLTIVGNGNFRSTLEESARALRLSAVNFVGDINNSDLPAYYRNAEVYILPSLNEAFGLTFCEAMACGTPVLGTAVGGIPAIVRNGVDGYVIPPANSNAIYHALIELKKNRNKLDRMGKKARNRITMTLNWQATAEAYIDNYRSAIAK